MPGEAPDLNVLFVTADQWRGDCLGAAGHPVVRTPHLDRLAAGGVSFRRHFAQAAPCGPSRASLYTGMYLMNHRSVLNGTPLDARHSSGTATPAARIQSSHRAGLPSGRSQTGSKPGRTPS